MEQTESTIDIVATPQAVWSVLDDLPHYPEWNPIVPHLDGRTTLGEVVSGELVIPNMPTPPLTPTISRVVAGRELRWLSVIPGEQGFSAEHIFILEPIDGGTRVIHREVFDGPAAPHLAEPIRMLVHPAYVAFDQALKARVEGLVRQDLSLHPSVKNPDIDVPATSTLHCLCETDRVEVSLSAPIAHNHLCGCSKCWKPEGALVAQTAVVASDAAAITAGESKVAIVDAGQSIKRHACTACGAHVLGTVEDPEHHFYGLAFVHPELATQPATGKPEFAGFVSSIIETGTSASAMQAVRRTLETAGIPAYDAFSPEIMDVIAYHKRKIASTTSHRSSVA